MGIFRIGAIASLLLTGCMTSGGGGGGSNCELGERKACQCAAGVSGFKDCQDDERFGACICAETDGGVATGGAGGAVTDPPVGGQGGAGGGVVEPPVGGAGGVGGEGGNAGEGGQGGAEPTGCDAPEPSCEAACAFASECAVGPACPGFDQTDYDWGFERCMGICSELNAASIICGVDGCEGIPNLLIGVDPDFAEQCLAEPEVPPESVIPGCDSGDFQCDEVCGWLSDCLVAECPNGDIPLVRDCDRICVEQAALMPLMCSLEINECADIRPAGKTD